MRRVLAVLASVTVAAGFLITSAGGASAAPAEGRIEGYPSDGPTHYCLISQGIDVGDTLGLNSLCLNLANGVFTIDGNAIAPIRLANGKCLDVKGAGTAPLTRVQLWSCNNTVAQLWQWVRIPDNGLYLVKNPNSGLCLISNLNASVISTCEPVRVANPDGGRNMFNLVPAL
jgi:hypothetical protein